MVPTKKVEKTPYEVWHGQAPKMSYLKVWGCEALVKRDTLTKHDKLEPSKWLFKKKKTDMKGAVHTYKARLVTKGYTQTQRIDYKETFSPVAYIRAIRILIAIAAGNNNPMLQDVKSYLGRCFAMKHLGKAAYILEIKIYIDRSWRLIEKLGLSKSQGASTPAELKHMQNVPYASAVGSIMYAVRCTRPDVTFAQNITSRFQQIPGDLHWTTVKNILKYLRNTKDMFLVYEDMRLNGSAVEWKSAMQSIFATSSAEAGYIAAFDASKEAVWV
nr:hypothetical protein [Tanacetum cinerariifolium]